MKKLSRLRETASQWSSIARQLTDALELAQMEDESLRADLEKETALVEVEIAEREWTAMMDGKFDSGNALLAIHAGAGGVDAQDWAEMLLRMYLRWTQARGFKVEMNEAIELATKYGDKDSGKFVNGTPADVRRETRRLLELGRDGGYIFAPAHSVPRDVPPENMEAFISEVHDQPDAPAEG